MNNKIKGDKYSIAYLAELTKHGTDIDQNHFTLSSRVILIIEDKYGLL